MTFARSLIGTLIVLGFTVQPAGADRYFYKGKVVSILVATSPGGATDRYSRLAARHISKHILGNPKIVVMNRPGGAGMLAANWVYNIAKKDGLTLGAINRALPLTAILGAAGAQFEPAKFNWIGTPVQGTTSCFVRSDSSFKTTTDLVKAPQPVKMAATQRRSDTFIVPLLLNSVLDTKMTVISGYRSIRGTASALRKREVDGGCGWSYTSVQALENDLSAAITIRVLKDVQSVASDLAKPDKKAILDIYNKQLSLGWPWVMAPRVPPERVETMRQAFTKLMKDPSFLKEAKKARIEINPLPGEALQTLVHQLVESAAKNKPELKKLFKY